MPAFDEKYKWLVPEEDDGPAAVLLSDRIALYAECVNLIDPFDPSDTHLRPACYDLSVGDVYYDNDRRVPIDQNGRFTIPANGLVYVKTKETLNIPYYMIARYSLQVTQVYRGLLIDNGLQVDPGYRGPIFVPVHNLVNEPRDLKHSERFLTIDFTRTTSFAAGLPSISTEKELIERRNILTGANGKRVVLFWTNPADLDREARTPEHFWDKYRGEKHKSSLIGLKEDVSRISWWSIGTIVALLLSLFLAVFPWVSGLYIESARRISAIEMDLKSLKDASSRVGEPPGAGAVAQPAVEPAQDAAGPAATEKAGGQE